MTTRVNNAKMYHDPDKRNTDQPRDADALHQLAILKTQQGHYEEAYHYLEAALKIDQTRPSFYNHAGNLLKKLNRFDEAEHAFKEALRLNPAFFEAYNNLGALYFARGAIDAAINYYQKALHLSPAYPDALYNLGIAYAKMHHTQEALNTFLELLTHTPHHLAAHYHLATLYQQQEAWTKAIEHFTQVLAIHPAHCEALTNLGLCYLKQDALSDAQIAYEKALDIDPQNFEAHYNLAIIAEEKNNTDLAIQHYLQAERIMPDDFAVQNNLGVAFIKRNSPEQALIHFKKALQLKPDQMNLQYHIDALSKNASRTHAPHDYIRSLFDQYAARFDQHLLESLDYQVPEQLYQRLQTLLPQKPLTILDAGCGTGLMAPFLKPHARRLIGVDLSPNMIEKARDKILYDELHAQSIEEYLTKNKNNFDLIVAADVLVYTGDLQQLFALCSSALVRKGLLTFSCETTETADYQLLPSGRFAHRDTYIQRLAEAHHFHLLDHHLIVSRMQYDKPVKGKIFILQKS